MKPVTIYTTLFCPYCDAAKRLLGQKGIVFDEIDVTMNRSARQTMSDRANGRYTVPQIFIGDVHVGGCDDLYDLDRAGQLDGLLAA
jgi:glutaredoxin 3